MGGEEGACGAQLRNYVGDEMSDLRKAAQQALEALETKGEHHPKVYEAITALRAALAQPEQEPVAWLWQHRETGRTRVPMPDERTATDVAAAWDVIGPLYLAPPQRKPLTEEEIMQLWLSQYEANREGTNNFARAIEKAHGIE